MSQLAENKKLVQEVFREAVNTGDLEAFRRFLAPDYARHSQATTEMPEIRGIDEMLAFLGPHFAAFPDWHEEVELMVAEGPYVACITRGTGTQTGPMGDVPATGKTMEVMNFIFHRIEDGRIAESWVGWDNLAGMMQLGLVPPPDAEA